MVNAADIMRNDAHWFLLICAIATVGLALAAFIELDLNDPEPSRPEASQDEPVIETVPASISRESSERWLRTLRDQGDVRFESARPGSGEGGFTMKPLEGVLDATEKARLLHNFDAAVFSVLNRKADFGVSLDPSSEDDILAEAGMSRSLAMYQAARQIIASDQYVLVKLGEPFVRKIPDGHVMTSNRVEHNGVAADAILYIRYEEHPELAKAQEYVDQVQQYWGRCKAAEFNALSLEARMQRVAAHDSVPERIRNPPEDVASDPNALEEWQSRLMRERLPDGLIVDRTRFLARYPTGDR